MVSHGGERDFPHRSDRLWVPPSLLYNGYWVSLPGVKWPGRDIDYPPPSKTKVKERVELYLYLPSGPPWPDSAWTLRLWLTVGTAKNMKNKQIREFSLLRNVQTGPGA